MSRFRFRYWDAEENVMRYADLLDIMDGYRALDFRIEWNDRVAPDVIAEREPMLMQSTGLKDKHGKEIFEGDIIKVVNKEVVAEIEWSKKIAGFCIKFRNKYNTARVQHWRKSIAWLMRNGCEIIGNKWENPELLDREVA